MHSVEVPFGTLTSAHDQLATVPVVVLLPVHATITAQAAREETALRLAMRLM
jgi:hypothetical protein